MVLQVTQDVNLVFFQGQTLSPLSAPHPLLLLCLVEGYSHQEAALLQQVKHLFIFIPRFYLTFPLPLLVFNIIARSDLRISMEQRSLGSSERKLVFSCLLEVVRRKLCRSTLISSTLYPAQSHHIWLFLAKKNCHHITIGDLTDYPFSPRPSAAHPDPGYLQEPPTLPISYPNYR